MGQYEMEHQFDVSLAKICCKLCSYGYDRMVGQREDKSLTSSLGVTRESLYHTGTLAAMLCDRADHRVLVLPGTESQWEFVRTPGKTLESLKDWAKNVQFRLTSGTTLRVPGRVHEGFCSEVLHLMPSIEMLIQEHSDLDGKELPLVITGHSQGGAEAAIAAGTLCDHRAIEQVITFAAPRPGDHVFSAWMANQDFPIWRCEYGYDIVPHMPRSLVTVPSYDFDGVGMLVYGEPNNATSIVQIGRGAMAVRRASRLAANTEYWVEHHHLTHYLEMLEAFPCDA